MGPPLRDSLELASLASSSHSQPSEVNDSSSSGARSSRELDFSDDDPLSGANGGSSRSAGHARSYSVSSTFDFAPTLFPLSSTAAGYTALGAPSSGDYGESGLAGAAGSLEKHKSLTYLNGLSLVVGLIIGSGIFSSPAQVNTNAGSPGASLLVWTVAGLLAWTGAASYAELGGAIPLNGGAQVYLSKIFGEWAGFLFTWCAVCVLKPGSAAIIAIIFGEYTVRAFIGAEALEVSTWINKGVALAGLLLVTLLNSVSTKLGTRSADLFMVLKFVALLFVTITGVVVAVTGFSWKGHASEDWKKHGWFDGTITDLSHWAVALYAGLWAFDGWDNVRSPKHPAILAILMRPQVNYVTGEFVNPSRDPPPRHSHISTPRNHLLHLRKRGLLLRPPHQRHKQHQHRRRSVRPGSLRPHRRSRPRLSRRRLLLRRPQRDHFHIRPPHLRCRQRRLPPRDLWPDWLRAASGAAAGRRRRARGEPATEPPPAANSRRRGHLLHANQRYGAQRGADGRLRAGRRVRHPAHLLRRRGLHLLLLHRPRPDRAEGARAPARATVPHVDLHAHYLLLRVVVSSVEGRVCAAGADAHSGCVRAGGPAGVLFLG